jgi:hypothetical protein
MGDAHEVWCSASNGVVRRCGHTRLGGWLRRRWQRRTDNNNHHHHDHYNNDDHPFVERRTRTRAIDCPRRR